MCEDEIERLGLNIYWFQNAPAHIKTENVNFDDPAEAIRQIDSAYQVMMSAVLDSLCNCHDLKLIDNAMRAIDRSQKTRRGIIKRDIKRPGRKTVDKE